MVNELHQQNGKNWRKFKVNENQFTLAERFAGAQTSSTYSFDKIGLLSPDRSIVGGNDIQYSERVTQIAGFTGLVSLIVGIALIDSNRPVIALLGLMYYVFIIIVALIVWKVIGSRKVQMLEFYLGNSAFRAYCRNDAEREEVESLLQQLRSAQNKCYKQKYLEDENIFKSKDNLERLERLYENDVITEAEFKKALIRYKKAN